MAVLGGAGVVMSQVPLNVNPGAPVPTNPHGKNKPTNCRLQIYGLSKQDRDLGRDGDATQPLPPLQVNERERGFERGRQ